LKNETGQKVRPLRQHLIDMRVEVEQSVTDDGINKWRAYTSPCLHMSHRKTYILNIHCDIN